MRIDSNNMDDAYYKWLLGLIKEDKLVKFYQNPRWRRLRLEALNRDHYECQRCKKKGKYARANNVHHLLEVKHVPLLALTLSNLECLCYQCHNEEHGRYVGKGNKDKGFVNFKDIERW